MFDELWGYFVLSMIMATLDKNSAAMVVDSPTNVSLTVRLIMQGKVRRLFLVDSTIHTAMYVMYITVLI